jgi:hypothetical protein
MAGFSPDEFACPITCNVMEDPVFTVDGHTYERKGIEDWFEKHDTSPSTGKTLMRDNKVDKTLIPNHALRKCIESWKKTRFDSESYIECSELQLNTGACMLEDMTDSEKGACPVYMSGASLEQKRLAEIRSRPTTPGSCTNKAVYRGIWRDQNVAILHMRTGTWEPAASTFKMISNNKHIVRFHGPVAWEDGSQHLVTELAPMDSSGTICACFKA